MNQKGFIVNIVMIAVVLGLVFVSQLPQFKGIWKDTDKKAVQTLNSLSDSLSEYLYAKIYPYIGGEVAKREAIAKEEIATQKDGAVKTVWEKIKNYFAEKFSEFSGTKVE
jgi:hypothetical protein